MAFPSKLSFRNLFTSNRSLSCFYGLLEVFFWNAPQLRRNGLLDSLHCFKTDLHDDPLEFAEEKKGLIEQDQVNREIIPVQWCSSWPRTAECLAHPILLLFRHAQFLDDNLPSTVHFHVQLTCNHSNSQVTIVTYHMPYTVDVDHSLCWKPPGPGVIFHLLPIPFEPLVLFKNTYARYGFISIHLLRYFKYLWQFSATGQRFQVYLLLGVHHSSLSA